MVYVLLSPFLDPEDACGTYKQTTIWNGKFFLEKKDDNGTVTHVCYWHDKRLLWVIAKSFSPDDAILYADVDLEFDSVVSVCDVGYNDTSLLLASSVDMTCHPSPHVLPPTHIPPERLQPPTTCDCDQRSQVVRCDGARG